MLPIVLHRENKGSVAFTKLSGQGGNSSNGRLPSWRRALSVISETFSVPCGGYFEPVLHVRPPSEYGSRKTFCSYFPCALKGYILPLYLRYLPFIRYEGMRERIRCTPVGTESDEAGFGGEALRSDLEKHAVTAGSGSKMGFAMTGSDGSCPIQTINRHKAYS